MSGKTQYPSCCRNLIFTCRSTFLTFETSTVLSRLLKTAKEFKRTLICRSHAVLCAKLGNFQTYVKWWWNIPFNSVQMCCTCLLEFNTCLFLPVSRFILMDFWKENINFTAAGITRYLYFFAYKFLYDISVDRFYQHYPSCILNFCSWNISLSSTIITVFVLVLMRKCEQHCLHKSGFIGF